jgi:hypothetical protein
MFEVFERLCYYAAGNISGGKVLGNKCDGIVCAARVTNTIAVNDFGQRVKKTCDNFGFIFDNHVQGQFRHYVELDIFHFLLPLWLYVAVMFIPFHNK